MPFMGIKFQLSLRSQKKTMKTACEDCINSMTFMIGGMKLRNGGAKEPKSSQSRKKKVPFNTNLTLVVLMAQA